MTYFVVFYITQQQIFTQQQARIRIQPPKITKIKLFCTQKTHFSEAQNDIYLLDIRGPIQWEIIVTF